MKPNPIDLSDKALVKLIEEKNVEGNTDVRFTVYDPEYKELTHFLEFEMSSSVFSDEWTEIPCDKPGIKAFLQKEIDEFLCKELNIKNDNSDS